MRCSVPQTNWNNREMCRRIMIAMGSKMCQNPRAIDYVELSDSIQFVRRAIVSVFTRPTCCNINIFSMEYDYYRRF